MPLCSLESGGTDPESHLLPGSRRITRTISRMLGMPIPLGTHLTVHLAGTWLSYCFQQIPRTPPLVYNAVEGARKKKKKKPVLKSYFWQLWLVISLPNEPVERWICRLILLPAQSAQFIICQAGQGGKERRWKLEAAVPLLHPPPVPSNGLSVLGILMIPPTSHSHPHQLPALRKENQEEGRKGF